MAVQKTSIAIGGPDPAILITPGMKKLVSHACATFASPPFTREEGGDDITEIELYTFATVQMPVPPVSSSESLC